MIWITFNHIGLGGGPSDIAHQNHYFVGDDDFDIQDKWPVLFLF